MFGNEYKIPDRTPQQLFAEVSGEQDCLTCMNFFYNGEALVVESNAAAFVTFLATSVPSTVLLFDFFYPFCHISTFPGFSY